MLDLDSLLADVQNEYKVCNRCKGVNLATLIPKLQKLDPEASIAEAACLSFCGPGRDNPFVFLNNKPVKGKTEAELLEKIQEIIA